DGTTNHQDGSTHDSSTGVDSAADAGGDAHDSGAADAADASDATVDAPADAAQDAAPDAAHDAADAADAADGDGGPALTYCQAQAGLNFCNDFDLDILNPLATDGGA